MSDLRIEDVCRLAPVIPVLVIEDLDTAVPLAEALVAGGLRALEITLRTPAALHAIKTISNAVPDAVIGAGTVRSAGRSRSRKTRELTPVSPTLVKTRVSEGRSTSGICSLAAEVARTDLVRSPLAAVTVVTTDEVGVRKRKA